MRILHTADWQLGCPFRSFGDRAEVLRAERLHTLRRALESARTAAVDAFLIAGDLFDDNQVAASLVQQTFGCLAAFPDLPVFILPGNHDPVSGPGCIWNRPPFANPPSHLHVFRQPEVVPIGDAFLLASPLTQKLSNRDPSLALVDLAKPLPAGRLKIGVTHGALAIETKYQPNDHPIHLQAASRAGLDYLAVGHWHTWQAYDHDRLVMPGTPEPDSFDHAAGRFGALVELSAPTQPPVLRQVELAGLHWTELSLDFGEGPTARTTAAAALAALATQADRTVLRVTLTGPADRVTLFSTQEWLQAAVAGFFAVEIRNDAQIRFSPAELEHLRRTHPLLAQVLADLAQLRAYHTGLANPWPDVPGTLSPNQARALCDELGLDPADLDEAFHQTAAVLLAEQLQEAAS